MARIQSLNCPNCGSNLPGNVAHIVNCPNCGSTLELTADGPDFRGLNKCTICEALNKVENDFCDKCGAIIKAECPYCKNRHPLLSTHFCPKSGQNFKNYAFFIAIRHNNHKLIDAFLKGDRELVNVKLGTWPIHAAVLTNDVSTVRKIIEYGADVNSADAKGKTPLILAAEKKFKDAVEELLNKGAVPDTADQDGTTALLTALKYFDKDVTSLLLEKGANPNHSDKKDRTPLILAVEQGRAEIVELLLKSGAKPDFRTNDGEYPLFTAVSKGDEKIISLLIDGGGDPNLKNDSDLPLLHFAAMKDNPLVMSLLLSKGADPNVLNRHGDTALMIAVNGEKVLMVETLLKGKADVNFKNKKGITPLFKSVERGSLKTAQLLLENGAMTEKTCTGKLEIMGEELEFQKLTPMHAAAAAGNVEMIELLKKFGASGKGAATTSGPPPQSYTPREMAEKNGHQQAAAILPKKLSFCCIFAAIIVFLGVMGFILLLIIGVIGDEMDRKGTRGSGTEQRQTTSQTYSGGGRNASITQTVTGSPVKTLEDNYFFIRQRRFKDAYNLRSSSAKRKMTYNQYYNLWSNNVTISLVDTRVNVKSDEYASVEVKLYSEDVNRKTGKTYKGNYAGTVELIPENGNWLIKDAQIMKWSDYTKRGNRF